MRDDSMLRSALALATAGLLATAGAAGGQEPLVLDPASAPAVEAQRTGPVVRGATIRLWGDRTIEAGERIDGSVVAFNGTLTVAGEVRGDVTVTRGELRLLEGAVIAGDAVVAGGRLVNEGARVGGEMRADDLAAGGSQARTAATRVRLRSPFAFFGGGEGVTRTLGVGLLLALVGVGMIFYGGPGLGRLSDTARGETVRAGGVGIAMLFLALPAFVLGAVALALTIIGIPFLVLYVPLFGVAMVALGVVGLVVVAHALGERTAEQRAAGGIEPGNRHTHLFTGLALLLGPLLVADVLRMTGALGFVGEVVALAARLALAAAGCVGAGAVLLHVGRAWRERRFRKVMGLGSAGGQDAAAV
jgi:hypothetical protein